MKKGIFCRTESVAMTPKSRDHMPTTSLWGVTAKWPTRAPKTKLILCPRDPQGYSRISLSLSGRILKEYWNIVSASKQTHAVFHWVCEIALTKELATQMGVMRHSKKVNSFELYKFNHTESVAMTPKSRDHMPTMSLWGVAAKWPTQAPKTKLIFCPRDPARIQPYQFEPVRQDFERVLEHRVSFEANPMRYSMGFAKSHSLKCSLHKWA